MLQISTKPSTKLVEIDGFAYKVRKLGAGESLTMQKSGREITKLGKIVELSDSQTEKLESLTTEVLSICLDLFKSDNKAARDYIKTLDIEVLLDIITQVFENEAEVS